MKFFTVLITAVLLMATSNPAVFNEEGIGKSLGIGELTLAPLDYVSTSQFARTLKVSNLQAGDSLRIKFYSQGCFHAASSKFLITRNDNGIVRARIEVPWLDVNGEAELSDSVLEGLDRQLVHYRTPDRGHGCTTQDYVRLSWTVEGGRKAHETFVDSTCWDREDTITLRELVRLVRTS